MKNVFIKSEIPYLETSKDVKYPRLAYYAIKDLYETWLIESSNSINYLNNDCLDYCLGIIGLRRIGKTTLLKHLYNTIDNSCYIDCTKFSIQDDFDEVLEYIHSNNVKLCLIDELCKLKSDNKNGIDCFVSAVKSSYNDMYFIFTGSASGAVKRIINDIVDCNEYNLIPITYTERLWWNNDCPSYNQLYNLTTYDNFINYISMMNDTSKSVIYIQGIITDTLTSHFNRESSYYSEKYIPLMNCSKEELIDMIRYIELCQVLTFTIKNGLSINSPVKFYYKHEDIVRLKHCIEDIKMSLKLDNLYLLCELLENSGLLIKENDYTFDTDVNAIIDNLNLKSYLFILPQIIYSTYNYLFDLVNIDIKTDELYDSISKSFRPLWVENIISAQCSLLYHKSGKYRYNEESEIDVVYRLMDKDCNKKSGYYLMEIKDRPKNKIGKYVYATYQYSDEFKTETKEYLITCRDIGFDKLNIDSCCDNSYIMRNDIVLITLELEYLLNQCNYGIKCGESIINLYQKYSNNKSESDLSKPNKNKCDSNNSVNQDNSDYTDTNFFI